MIPDLPDLGSEDLRSMQRSTFGAARKSSQNRTKLTEPHARMEETSKNYECSKNRCASAIQKIPQLLVEISSWMSWLNNTILYWTGN